MNAKIVTLAIVLIVAIPILMGYALAFEKTEDVGYESGERTNVTDLATNTTRPYLTNLSPMYLNSTLYYDYYTGSNRVTYPSTPQFLRYSTTIPSPLPLSYEDESHSFSLTQPYGESYIYHSSAPLNQNTLPVPNNLNWIKFSSYNGETMTLTTTVVGTTYTYTGSEFGPFVSSGNTYMTWVDVSGGNNSRYISLTDFTITAPEGTQIDMAGRYSSNVTAGFQFPDIDFTQATFILSPNEALRWYVGEYDPYASSPQASYYYVHRTQPIPITQVRTAAPSDEAPWGKFTLHIGDSTVVENVAAVFATISPGTSSLPALMTIVQPGFYVDPSYGWTLRTDPDGSGVPPDNAIWYNGHRNYNVRMMMSISNGSSLVVSPYEQFEFRPNETLISRSSGGMVSVNDAPLGDYTYLCLDFTGYNIKISGITAWPTIGQEPTILNSIDVINETYGELSSIPISYIELREIYNIPGPHGAAGITYRVDSASVHAGQYPVIYNSYFDLSQYWPDKSFSIQLSSISEYGTSIRLSEFDEVGFEVENGSITVNGKKIPLRNAIFSSVYSEDDGRWHYSINGITPEDHYNSSTRPLKLYFGGEWACIVYAYELNEYSRTVNEWQPGTFAFNGVDNSFALLGLAGSAAVFIALALYGRHSGAKVGTLLLVCGFAGLIFLCMIV